jgi:hypothetical protein
VRYVTDAQVGDLTVFQDKSPEDRAQVLVDAGDVYGYVHANPWVSDGDLRAWGEQRDLGPDRMNDALGFLRQVGKIVDMNDPQTADNALPRLDLSALKVEALDDLIDAHDLDVPKSAKKEEKVAAIQAATA